MSQEQLHKPEALSEMSTNFQTQEEPAAPVPSPVPSTNGQLQEEAPTESTLTSAKQELQEQQEQKPHSGHAMTYGDVFPVLASQEGPLAGEAITTEDASLMQTAEWMAFGKTQKHGAASAMQSAAAKNVHDGWVEKDAHSRVSEYGLSVTKTAVPGAEMDVEYVAGQPVAATAHPTPTDPAIASMDAVTIGEALEAAAMGAGDRPVEDSDARAIESAERRATGVSMPMKGGIGATAQSAAQLNHQTDAAGQTTISDVLMDASEDLPADKVVTYEDAYKVLQAELRGRDPEDLQPGGIGATLLVAADMNARSGMIPPPPGSIAEESHKLDLLDSVDTEDEAELRKYEALGSTDLSTKTSDAKKSLDDNIPTQIHGTEKETTPLVSSNVDEQVPSHGSDLSTKPSDAKDSLVDNIPTQIHGTEEETTPLVSRNVDE
ncbi:unnamed protein product [Calypogeia fissa]